jgi:hypothetical protein
MRDLLVGRVLLASLHQAIADTLPVKLGFYESWLHAEGLRHGTIGLAPLTAVLSFLRQEGTGYDRVMRLAGEYAAEWTVETMPSSRRAMIGAMPSWIRARIILRLARRLVRDTCQTSRAVARLRRGVARMEVRDSVFCSVREPVDAPLCGFYAAAVARLMALFGLEADARVETCRAKGDSACVLTVGLAARRAIEGAERSTA